MTETAAPVGSETTLLQHVAFSRSCHVMERCKNLPPHSLRLVLSNLPARAPCLAAPATQRHSSCPNLHLSLSCCFVNTVRRSLLEADSRQAVLGKWFCRTPFLPFLFPTLFFFFSLPPLFSLFYHSSSATKFTQGA
jgi:hypothetical protein